MQRRRGLKFPTTTPDQPGGIALSDNFVELGNRIPQCNFVATTNPTITDDSESGGVGYGYWPGSKWYNQTTGQVFECLSGAVGAAVWKTLSADGTWNATPYKLAQRDSNANCAFNAISLNEGDAGGIDLGGAALMQVGGKIETTVGFKIRSDDGTCLILFNGPEADWQFAPSLDDTSFVISTGEAVFRLTDAGDFRISGALGVGNAEVADTITGPIVKRIEVFDSAGVSLGYIAVYENIVLD